MATAHPPHAHEATPEHLASGDHLAMNSPLSERGGKSTLGRILLYAIPVLIVLAVIIYFGSRGTVGAPDQSAMSPAQTSSGMTATPAAPTADQGR